MKYRNLLGTAFGATLCLGVQAIVLAAEGGADTLEPDASLSVAALETAEMMEAVSPMSEAIAITTVDELSDISPDHWAYQALQALVEQYACLAGYPDGTFRGDNTLTRYEFAAVLDSCLSFFRIRGVTPCSPLSGMDCVPISRLQEEFQKELARVESRIDALETETAALRDTTFSTTTRLRGEVVLSLEQLAGGDKANGSGDDLREALTFGSRARLNFNTSFTGRDLLKVRLDALNPSRLTAPTTGTNMTRLAFDRDTNSDFDIGKFFYRFPVGDRLSLHIDATRGAYQANVSSTFNPGLASPISGVVSRFGRFNPIYYQGALGTGITGVYDIAPNLAFSAGYLSRGPGASNANEGGLFGGGYTALAQLDYRPTDTWGLGLAYARSYYPSGELAVSAGTGSRLANAPFGGNIATSANHFGLQSTLKLGSANLSGWAGLSLASAESGSAAVEEGDSATLLNWAVTLGLPNLGGQGNLGGLVVGNPPRVLSNNGGVEEDDATWHVEAFYRYRVNPNLSLIPGFFVLINPENNSDNDTIWVGSFRTVFEF